MKKIKIFFLKKQKEWYTSKIEEYQTYLQNLNLFGDIAGIDFEYKYTKVFEIENQLGKYKEKRKIVSQKIKELKQCS